MMIDDILKEKNMSVYKLAKISGVPYATVNDICHGKTSPEKCSAETIYKIAKALDISMEGIIEPYIDKRGNTQVFYA